jgi:hypothetical protein
MKKISHKTESVTTYQLTEKDLLEMLIDTGKIDRRDSVKIYFQVPGGGDYSNMTLNIDEGSPIVLTVKNES